jgi:hypothetical protein
MPKYYISALARGCTTFLSDSLIIGCHTPHNEVEATGCAIEIDPAVFSPNYPGLHPNTRIIVLLGLFF